MKKDPRPAPEEQTGGLLCFISLYLSGTSLSAHNLLRQCVTDELNQLNQDDNNRHNSPGDLIVKALVAVHNRDLTQTTGHPRNRP